MYPVSQSYIDKLKSKDTKIRRIRGYVDSVAFTENDVLDGSFNYTDMCVKSSEIKLGGVFIGQLNLTFLQSFVDRFPRGSWKNRVITCSVGLFLGYDSNNEEIWVDVPIKPYIIDDPQHSALGLDVVAYDAMYKFNEPYTATQTIGKPYDLAMLSCDACGVQLGMTESEMNALPNGTELLGIYPENDIETHRDVLSWIAVAIGGFATINREGKLEFRTWKNKQNPDITIGIDDRYEGGLWSDFYTKYTEIKIDDMVDGVSMYYHVDPNNGMTMDIGSNPLLQYGTSETKARQRMAVLNAIQNLNYVPFSSESLIDPALDLGDIIYYPNGIPNGAVGCVMRIDFSFSKGAKVKGYGKNPAQSGARSTQDKALTQAMSKTKENELVIHAYENAQNYTIGDGQREAVIIIDFSTMKPTTVVTWAEINLDLDITDESGVASVTAYYYLNGQLQTYKPVGSWNNDGMHLLNLMFPIRSLDGGGQYEWRVALQVDGGSAFIGRGKIHAVLEGQGLVAVDEFDGRMILTETYTCARTDKEFARWLEAIEFEEIAYFRIQPSDRMVCPTADKKMAEWSEAVEISFWVLPAVPFMTEDGEDEIITEDGETLLTEGEIT